MLSSMKHPVYVRPLTDAERSQLVAGLRSSDAFVHRGPRSCSPVLAASRRPRSRATWAATTRPSATPSRRSTRGASAALRQRLAPPPPVPRRPSTAVGAEQLRALLHQSPRTFGKPTSLWTLELAAEVSFAQGLTAERVSGETIRRRSCAPGRPLEAGQAAGSPAPIPSTPEKKCARPPDPPGRDATRPGSWASRTRSGGVGWRGPALHAWAEEDQPLRLVEQAVAKDDPDPKALACYGLLLRADPTDEDAADQMWLRFVDGRPVSAVTIDFLAWCCAQAPGRRQGGAAAGLGQRLLARQPSGARLDPRPQPPGQAARPGRAARRLLPAESRAPGSTPIEPKWVARQAARRRSRRACSPRTNSPTASAPPSTARTKRCSACRSRSTLISLFPKRLPDLALGTAPLPSAFAKMGDYPDES